MPDLDEQRVTRISEAIVSYFDSHPNAADSVTGIMQWWLPRSLSAPDVMEVKTALDRLVAAGRARRSLLPDGTELYGRCPLAGDRDTAQ